MNLHSSPRQLRQYLLTAGYKSSIGAFIAGASRSCSFPEEWDSDEEYPQRDALFRAIVWPESIESISVWQQLFAEFTLKKHSFRGHDIGGLGIFDCYLGLSMLQAMIVSNELTDELGLVDAALRIIQRDMCDSGMELRVVLLSDIVLLISRTPQLSECKYIIDALAYIADVGVRMMQYVDLRETTWRRSQRGAQILRDIDHSAVEWRETFLGELRRKYETDGGSPEDSRPAGC
ncbi:MAG: hypothetical protein ACOYN0_04540 [Phycisphaerales bacterium]